MAADYKTPGVYIVEKNAFANSVVGVETAVPAFIGYTEIAERNGKSLIKVPTKVSSLHEYIEMFGGAFHAKYDITEDPTKSKESFSFNNKSYLISPKKDNQLCFYNAIRLFYSNGGADCYIVSVDTYKDKDGLAFDANDFGEDVWQALEKEIEPTLVLIPDLVKAGEPATIYNVNNAVLLHCNNTQSRFGIFDVPMLKDSRMDIEDFRNNFPSKLLNYGAAYYPYLKTSVVSASEVTFLNIENDPAKTLDNLPDNDKKALQAYLDSKDGKAKVADLASDDSSVKEAAVNSIHQNFKSISGNYEILMTEIRSHINLLPPSAALAGLYTLVDNTRGVWKAPANYSLASVNGPAINISTHEQENINVDAVSGKSINAIRPFPGIGTLVWGARTLDGNSQDWRYINVRRTLIFIEQSLKLATRTYVFEPNDSGTWVTISSMMNAFLNNLWKQGALFGSAPEEAFNVTVGLGTTMTPNDILDGYMRITVKVSIVRPAEFIEITFQQKQMTSV